MVLSPEELDRRYALGWRTRQPVLQAAGVAAFVVERRQADHALQSELHHLSVHRRLEC